MGLLTSKLGIHALSIEDPAQPLQPYSVLFESLGLGQSDAGVLINEKQALAISTVFSCVKVISEDIASMPHEVYQSIENGRIAARFHRLYPILHDAPNDHSTAATFWQTLYAWALLWGNGFALIERDKATRAKSLRIMPGDKTRMMVVDGKVWCVTTATPNGTPEAIDPFDVLHLPGMSLDGLNGISPIQTCKNAFGLSKAAEKFGAQLFGNGARTSGILTHPNTLGTEAYENLKKSIKERLSGQNALSPLILEEGMTWNQISINPDDAQFLQTRKFQRSEICAIFRVPLHKVQDLERSTNNNIEQQALEYHQSTLVPWCVRLEQEIRRKLFAGTPFFSEFDMRGLLRGDFKSRQEGNAIQRANGIIDTNEWRASEGMNPISDEDGGSTRIVQVNMVDLKQIATGNPSTSDTNDPDAEPDPMEAQEEGHNSILKRDRIVSVYRRLFRDAVGRIAHRQVRDGKTICAVMVPMISSMAEAMYSMELPGKPQLSESQKAMISAHCQAIDASNWNKSSVAGLAEEQAQHAYEVLSWILFGRKN